MTTTRDPLARAAAEAEERFRRRQREVRERLLNGLGSPTIVAWVRAVDKLESGYDRYLDRVQAGEEMGRSVSMLTGPAEAVLEARDAYLKSLMREEL